MQRTKAPTWIVRKENDLGRPCSAFFCFDGPERRVTHCSVIRRVIVEHIVGIRLPKAPQPGRRNSLVVGLVDFGKNRASAQMLHFTEFVKL
jgi:hypothetical protein